MEALKLPRRLQMVADHVPGNLRVADIGSDHALLACYLCLQGTTRRVIATELARGPYRSATHQVHRLGLCSCVSVRLGDGLRAIRDGEVDVIVMAGMGGHLMIDILEAGKAKLLHASRLVLQPNLDEETVRRWLLFNGWELIDEAIVEEESLIYELLVAEPGQARAPYSNAKQQELAMGPFLVKEKSPDFIKKWQKKLRHDKQIYGQLQQAAPTKKVVAKMQWLKRHIHELEGILDESNRKRTDLN